MCKERRFTISASPLAVHAITAAVNGIKSSSVELEPGHPLARGIVLSAPKTGKHTTRQPTIKHVSFILALLHNR
jgi:hypothetical protein